MGFIYKITNKVNGKVYIGQTRGSIEERFKEHKQECSSGYNPKRHFHMAMKKYGFEVFEISLIEEILDTKLKVRVIVFNPIL